MQILLAPAETKQAGGSEPPLNLEALLFPELKETRQAVLKRYNAFVSSAADPELSAFFGLKDPRALERYRIPPESLPTMKAIERYTGVAFTHLEYGNLSETEKQWVDEHVLLFSNLFGPLRAGDLIPDYKFKQGAKLPGFSVERHYREAFTPALDAFLRDPVVDLRAGYYEKFYTLARPHITMQFFKGGKVVSHWAKAYRGAVTRLLAKHRPVTRSDLAALPLPGLSLREIRHQGAREIWLFDVA